jgi:hypothetical protein
MDRLLSSRWLVGLLCGLGVLMTNLPVIADRFGSVQGDLIDGRIVHYFLEHGYRWARRAPLDASLWDAPFFHPMRNALAYSDTMISAVPFYAPLRLLGLPPDTSFQWWVMLVVTATFASAYALGRGVLRLTRFSAAMAAFLVAFGAPRAAQMGHPQLLTQVFSVLAILMAAVAVRDVRREDQPRWRTNALLAGAILCLALQFYASVYLGWLTALGVLIAIAVCLCSTADRTRLDLVVRRGALGLVLGLALSAVLLVPFVVHYRAAAADLGPRSWEEVSCFLPAPTAWLAPDAEHWLYGRLSGLFVAPDDPCRPEKALSFGYVTLVACLAGFVVGRRRPEARVVTMTFAGLVACATVIGGASLWWFIYEGIPGAIAIRAVGRIVLVALVPASLGLAYLLAHLEARGRRGLALGLGIVCIAEQGVTTKHYERDEARMRIAHAAAAIPDACGAFYLSTELHPVYSAITAMWAGLERNVATVNGHSGSWPPGYPFAGAPIAERPAVVATWVGAHGGDMSRVCLVDTRVRARLVSVDVPRTMVQGQRYDVTVVVDNLGPKAWTRTDLVRIGVVGTVDWGLGRVELPHDVPPGQRVTFRFQVVAPATTGTLPFLWGIVEEGVEWKTEDLGLGTVTIVG